MTAFLYHRSLIMWTCTFTLSVPKLMHLYAGKVQEMIAQSARCLQRALLSHLDVPPVLRSCANQPCLDNAAGPLSDRRQSLLRWQPRSRLLSHHNVSRATYLSTPISNLPHR